MKYLVVCTTKDKHYLGLDKPGNEGSLIMRFTSKESLIKAFEGHAEIVNMQPIAIEASEDPTDVKKFVITEDVKFIRVGENAGYFGVEVSADILKLKQFDVSEEISKIANASKN